MRRDDNAADKDKSLDAAEQKLSEVKARPLEVGKILAQHRATEERDREAHKKAEEKLEATHSAGAQKRNEMRARELEATAQELREKQDRFEETKRLEAEKQRRADSEHGEEDAHRH